MHIVNEDGQTDEVVDIDEFLKNTRSLRNWEDPDVILITEESYVGKKDEDVCPWNPNQGGCYIKNERDRLWSDRPFVKFRNVHLLADLDKMIKTYLGPLPTSGEGWTWCLKQRLKDGTGRKYYCSFGGRANQVKKLPPLKIAPKVVPKVVAKDRAKVM